MSENFLKRIRYYISRSIACCLPDKLYLSIKFRTRFGYWMDWNHPKTFSEKLQWLKIFDRHDEYTRMVDKLAAKEYVSQIIGGEYIVPTLKVYDTADEIDFKDLPSQFVLKCTHDSGSLVICEEKDKLNEFAAKQKLKKGLRSTYVIQNREYPYAKVPRKIIAEEFIKASGDLKDYKFYCFEGNPYCVLVCGNRRTNLTFDYYDLEWNSLPIVKGHGRSLEKNEKPKNFEKMIELAKILCQGFHFIRVDFYNIEGRIYFGELTFFPGSGMQPFSPMEWDYRFGDCLHLPTDDV